MDLVVASLAVVVGLVFLERAAEEFTEALGTLAQRLRASEGTVGLLTAGGEWEELVVVVAGVLSGHPGIAVGNIVGACIANLIGSLPLGMLARRPLEPDRSARVYGYVLLGVTALAAAFAVDGTIAPTAGGILIAVFAGYVVSVILVVRRGWLEPPREADEDDDADDADDGSRLRLAVTLIVSLVVISLAAEAIVQGAVVIAEHVGLSDYAIGATVVAVGTTLPDKAFSLIGRHARTVRRGDRERIGLEHLHPDVAARDRRARDRRVDAGAAHRPRRRADPGRRYRSHGGTVPSRAPAPSRRHRAPRALRRLHRAGSSSPLSAALLPSCSGRSRWRVTLCSAGGSRLPFRSWDRHASRLPSLVCS